MGQLDVIALRGITAEAVHGVLEKEWNAPQTFTVDLLLWVDTDRAALSDDIAETVSYAEIAEKAHAILVGPSVRLIETLGHKIADAALEDSRVRGVEVIVHKPEAPIDVPFTDVSVTIRKGDIPLPFVAASNVVPPSAPDADEDALPAPSSPSAPSDAVASQEEESQASDSDKPVQLHSPAAPQQPATASELVVDTAEESESVQVEEPAQDELDVPSAPRAVVLALGGNLGNVPVTLKRAIDEMSGWDGLEITQVSPLVRTRAVLRPGQKPQPDYWNAVALGTVSMAPLDLLDRIHELEARLGRVRHEVWGSRTIDIDIIQIEGVSSDDPRLTLPHPRAHQRAFVLSPWLMAQPKAELSGFGAAAELIAQAPDRGGILDAVGDWREDPESVIADSDELLHRMRLPRLDHAEQLRPLKLETNSQSARPSRLDMLPEASRSGLAPTDEGTDVTWHRLWDRWGAPVESVESRHVELSKPSVSAVSEAQPAPAPQETTVSSPADTSGEVPAQLASRQVPAPSPVSAPPLRRLHLSATPSPADTTAASANLAQGMVSLEPRRPVPSAEPERPVVERQSLLERLHSSALPHAIPEAAPQFSDTQSTQEPAQNSPSTSPITAEVPVGRRTRRPRWRPVTEEGTGISTANSPRPFRARTDRLAAQSHRAKPSHRAPAPQEQQKPATETAQPRRSSLFARRPEPASSAGTQASAPAQGDARTQSGAPTQNVSGAKPSAASAQRKSASQARTSRALPGWNFSEDVRVVDDSSVLSPREDVRVVDDSSALSPREDVRRPSPSLPPRYSHVLDPKLDDSIDQGPMTPGSQTPSSVNRDVTIRPSITGQIPVFRRRPEDS
ncbi:2-amino-4-hydroxy-6-hydroxymethyldihydropteridine diphosphokinase [Actinomyces sp.]